MRLSYVHKITGANEYVTEDAHWPGEGGEGERKGWGERGGRSCDDEHREINLTQ